MSLEAVEKVTQAEKENRERMVSAQAAAKQLIADAEENGRELLKKTRELAAAEEKKQIRQAEESAAVRTDEISRAAEAEGQDLCAAAEPRLKAAVALIVGKVVND